MRSSMQVVSTAWKSRLLSNPASLSACSVSCTRSVPTAMPALRNTRAKCITFSARWPGVARAASMSALDGPSRHRRHKRQPVDGLESALCVPRKSAHAVSVRGAAGGTRWGLMVWRSALRSDCAAMLALESRRASRCAHCVRCARPSAASQSTKRARRARRLQCCASRRPTNRPHRVPPTAQQRAWCSTTSSSVSPARLGAGRCWREWQAPSSAAPQGASRRAQARRDGEHVELRA